MPTPTLYTWTHTIGGQTVDLPILVQTPEGANSLAIDISCCCGGCPPGCPTALDGPTFCTEQEAAQYVAENCDCCGDCGGFVRQNIPGFDESCREENGYDGTITYLPSWTAVCCAGYGCGCGDTPNWPDLLPGGGGWEGAGCHEQDQGEGCGHDGYGRPLGCGIETYGFECSREEAILAADNRGFEMPCNGNNCADQCYMLFCHDCSPCTAGDERWQCKGNTHRGGTFPPRSPGQLPYYCYTKPEDEEIPIPCCDSTHSSFETDHTGGWLWIACQCRDDPGD